MSKYLKRALKKKLSPGRRASIRKSLGLKTTKKKVKKKKAIIIGAGTPDPPLRYIPREPRNGGRHRQRGRRVVLVRRTR